MDKIFGITAVVALGLGLAFYFSNDQKNDSMAAKDSVSTSSSTTPATPLSNQSALGNGRPQTLAEKDAGFAESMRNIARVTDKMDSDEYYAIFQNLTAQVRAYPEYADKIAKKILESKDRDPSTRRQLSAMFGALAESNHSTVADRLVGLANECPDNYCKVQALMGVNTHSAPTPENAKALMAIANTSTDPEVSATAIIAAGAVGQKLGTNAPELSKEIIQSYNDPKEAAIKTSTIAAMGNHGSSEYLPILTQDLNSKESSIRAASVYSLRNIPGPGVNQQILKVIETDKSTSVVSEAVKALAYRKVTGAEYNAVATRVAKSSSSDLQEQTARLLVDAYRVDPASASDALETLKGNATNPSVKKYIEAEMKPVTTPASRR